MGARRDETDRALLIAAAVVIIADCEQAGELALAAGIGLQADGVVTRDRNEHLLQLGDHLAVALGTARVGVGVNVGELGPRDRHHLGGCVELHRARTEWDHRSVQGEILVGETAQVAQHLVFAVIPVEHRMAQDLVCPPRRWGDPLGGRLVVDDRLCAIHHLPHEGEGCHRRCLVEREADRAIVDSAQFDRAGSRPLDHMIGRGHDAANGVEPRAVDDLDARCAQTGHRDGCQPVYALSDPPQTLGTVPGSVEAGHVGEEHLGGADVRGRLLAADVLFACLEREPQRRPAGSIGADADEAAG